MAKYPEKFVALLKRIREKDSSLNGAAFIGGEELCTEELEQLVEALNTNSFITKLIFKNTVSGSKDEALKPLLATKYLTDLDISAEKGAFLYPIVDDGVAAFLATHPTLRVLRVQNQNLQKAGLQALLQNPRLESLDVSDNQLLDNESIDDILRNTTLTSLNISGNSFTSKRLKRLATDKQRTLIDLVHDKGGIGQSWGADHRIAKNKKHASAYIAACYTGDYDTVARLRDKVSPLVRNKEGKTGLELATELGYMKIIALLSSALSPRGTKVEAPEPSRRGSLMSFFHRGGANHRVRSVSEPSEVESTVASPKCLAAGDSGLSVSSGFFDSSPSSASTPSLASPGSVSPVPAGNAPTRERSKSMGVVFSSV